MCDKLQRWLNRDGMLFLQELGLQSGDSVLDFGCGNGNYTIPAGKVVGNDGLVYALDRDIYALKNLMKNVSVLGMSNIVPVHNLEELKQFLGNGHLDVALFYDVIHSYYFTEEGRKRLLTSISTMVKKSGLISIFPRHMERREIITFTDTLEKSGFYLEKERSTYLIHDDRNTYGSTLHFRKKAGIYHAKNKSIR